MNPNFHSGLLKDNSLMLYADDYNVIIQVGDNQNKKEFHAHSNILGARSPYFKNIFSADIIKKENDMIRFNKPNITPIVFEMILKYIYTGELNLTNQLGAVIFELLVTSEELFLRELLNYVQEYLIKQETCWVQQNFVLVLNTTFNLPNCKKLQDHCIASICKDPLPVFTSSDFLSIDREVLFYLIKQDIKDIVAWDYLIEWGIKQTSELKNKNNRNEWTDKNYEDLKNTLSNFIPLINFLNITSDDFYDKVRPYEAIIPNNIYEAAMAYYLVEQPKFQINPNIIKPKLAYIISNWIDKRNATFIRTEKDPPYNFNLIYRGSRDGINNSSFKRNCNGNVASLVLIKVQKLDKIFGGYSSIGFNSIGNDLMTENVFCGVIVRCYKSLDNFIFSFEDSEDDVKISRVMNNSKAILEHDRYGFNFGGSLRMIDRYLDINNKDNNYENNLNLGTLYTIEDIETFIVL